MGSLFLFIKHVFLWRHTVQDHCGLNHPYRNNALLLSRQSYFFAVYHWAQKRFGVLFQVAHPSSIAMHFTDSFCHEVWSRPFPSIDMSFIIGANGPQTLCLSWQLFNDFRQPVRPDMFIRIGTTATEYAKMFHGGLDREEKTKDQEGCGNPHSEAGRLLQQSEESRHALSDQRQ